MWKEFKEFALKGNVLDMAIGVIIGGAFGKIVTSLVNDVIMPIFGYLTAGMDFKALKLVLSPAELASDGSVLHAESAILYGNFVQNVVDFFIIAFCIFLFVKLANRVRNRAAKQEAAEAKKAEQAAKTSSAEELLTEIRDLLKAEKEDDDSL